MGAVRNQRAGLTGSVSLSSGQQFGGDVYSWKQSLSIPTKDRPGPGTPRFAVFRRLNVGSVFAFRMNGTGLAAPVPVGVVNSTATFTLTYNTGQTVALAGEIVGFEISYGAGKRVNETAASENWDIGISIRLTAEPVWSGWSGQVTPSTQTFADQEEDAGMSKSLDPWNLATGARRQWDVGTIADTTSAQTNKIQHFLTSATPIATLKARGGQLQKTDRGGAVVAVEYAKRDTRDDLLNPNIRNEIDPWGLRSAYTSATMLGYGSSSAFPTPAPTSGFKIVSVETGKIDDQFVSRRYQYGLVDSRDSVINPQVRADIDNNNIRSWYTSGAVLYHTSALTFPTPTPASGFKFRGYSTAKLNDVYDSRHFQFGLTDTKDDLTMPVSVRTQDPTGIHTSFASAAIVGSAFPGPAAIFGALSYTSSVKEYRQLNDGRFISVTRYDPFNSAQRLEAARTVSRRSASEFFDQYGTVLVSSLDDDAVATAQFAIAVGESNFVDLEVQSLTPNRKIMVSRFQDVGTRVIGSTMGGPRYLPAIMTSGTIKIYIPKVQSMYGTWKRALHQSVYYKSKPRRRLRVRRVLNQAAPVPDHAAYVGYVNSDTFLGLAAGTVIYKGAEYDINVAASGTLPMVIDYIFETDAAGFFDYQGVMDAWFDTRIAVAQGYNAVSLFTDGTCAAQTPSSTAFVTLFGFG